MYDQETIPHAVHTVWLWHATSHSIAHVYKGSVGPGKSLSIDDPLWPFLLYLLGQFIPALTGVISLSTLASCRSRALAIE